jgi:hypothetical protein
MHCMPPHAQPCVVNKHACSKHDHSTTEQCRDTHDEGDNEKPSAEWLKLEIRTTHAVGHKESQ